MSSSNRQASLSPNERQRTKSNSSARSHRSPPTVVVHEADGQPRRSPKRTAQETKRGGSSSSNPSTNIVSPKTSPSKRQKAKGKTSLSPNSKSPSPNRKDRSKKKKTPSATNDTDEKQVAQTNNAEEQDLSYRGLSVVPGEVFDRTFYLPSNFNLLSSHFQ